MSSGLLPDWMIERDVKIVPFAANQSRPGVISYGVTSYGYDVRLDRKFKVFTNVWGAVVDPKNFDPRSFVEVEGDYCLIPPNSFVLAETIEYIRRADARAHEERGRMNCARSKDHMARGDRLVTAAWRADFDSGRLGAVEDDTAHR